MFHGYGRSKGRQGQLHFTPAQHPRGTARAPQALGHLRSASATPWETPKPRTHSSPFSDVCLPGRLVFSLENSCSRDKARLRAAVTWRGEQARGHKQASLQLSTRLMRSWGSWHFRGDSVLDHVLLFKEKSPTLEINKKTTAGHTGTCGKWVRAI